MKRKPFPCPKCGLGTINGHDRIGCDNQRNNALRPPTPVVLVAATLDNGLTRFMREGKANEQMGGAKGGRTTAARGTAHHWTREEAQAAARKSHQKRFVPYGHARASDGGVKPRGRVLGLGTRPSRPDKARPRTDRPALRIQYTNQQASGVWYVPATGQWWRRLVVSPEEPPVEQVISERTALMQLGHLRKWYRRTTGVPTAIVRVDPQAARRRAHGETKG